MINLTKNQKGSTIILALVILAAILGSSVGVASIFVREIRLSSELDNSLIAIMAADAGLEKMLYNVRVLDGTSVISFSANLPNGASYVTCEDPGTCSDDPVILTSTGIFGDVKRTLEANLGSSSLPPTILEVRVSQDADDAEEDQSSGSVSDSSSDLELVYDGGLQYVGMKFRNITIDQGAVITSAYIEFEVDDTNNQDPAVTIFYGEDTDDAPDFSGSNGDISGRTPTSATVTWSSIPPWSPISAKYQTPDLAPIIQEIVNRPGWSNGNSIVIVASPGSGRRSAEAHDGEPANAPLLHIEY